MNFDILEMAYDEVIPLLESRIFERDPESTPPAPETPVRHWVLQENGTPCGFAIVIVKAMDAHLQLFGVVPEKRHRGAATQLLRHVEEQLADAGVTRLTVHSYNRWNAMLRLLLAQEYRIINTEYNHEREDARIILQKALRLRKELRISLTSNCNFKCPFCHNEGLEKCFETDSFSAPKLIGLLKLAVQSGFTDLTFTGGEPLLERDRFFSILEALTEMEIFPHITLVTNGYFLDEVTIRRLTDWNGPLKIHVSLHGPDEESFSRATHTNAACFRTVIGHIRQAVAANLFVKINCVILKGINHDRIRECIELAHQLGAKSIKLLELLVLPDNHEDYAYYCDIANIRKAVSDCAFPAQPIKKSRRQQTFSYRENASFLMEVQQLTCSLGCIHCRELRDRTISATLDYYPCMARSRHKMSIPAPENFEEVVAEGDRIVDGFALKYGDKSPSIIKKNRYVASRRELYFLIDIRAGWREALAGAGWTFDSKLAFWEEYFMPQNPDEEWRSYRKVLRIGQDQPDDSAVEMIFSWNSYEMTPLGMQTSVCFLDPEGPIRLNNTNLAHQLLSNLAYQSVHRANWSLETWVRETDQACISISTQPLTSVCLRGDSGEVEKLYQQLSQLFNLQILEHPFMYYYLN